MELLGRAAAAFPSDPQAAIDTARLLAALQRNEKSVEKLTTVLRDHPRESAAVVQLAELLVDMGEIERAESVAERASWLGAPEAESVLERIRSLRGASRPSRDEAASS